MTIESIIRSRTQVWADLFHDYGYEPNPLPARVPRYPSELLLRADKMTVYGNHPCSLTITDCGSQAQIPRDLSRRSTAATSRCPLGMPSAKMTKSERNVSTWTETMSAEKYTGIRTAGRRE